MSFSDARPVRKHHVNLLDTMKKRKTGERGTGLQCFLGKSAKNLASLRRECLLCPRGKQITMLVPSAPWKPLVFLSRVSMHTAWIADIPVKLPESLVPLHTNYMTLCIMYKAKMLGMHPMIPEHAQNNYRSVCSKFHALKKYQTRWSCAVDTSKDFACAVL